MKKNIRKLGMLLLILFVGTMLTSHAMFNQGESIDDVPFYHGTPVIDKLKMPNASGPKPCNRDVMVRYNLLPVLSPGELKERIKLILEKIDKPLSDSKEKYELDFSNVPVNSDEQIFEFLGSNEPQDDKLEKELETTLPEFDDNDQSIFEKEMRSELDQPETELIALEKDINDAESLIKFIEELGSPDDLEGQALLEYVKAKSKLMNLLSKSYKANL